MKRALAVLALLLVPVLASAQITISSAGGGGDTAVQTNFCGPDSPTNVEIGSCTNDANGGTGGTSTVVGNASTNSGNAAGSVIYGSANTLSATGTNNIVIGTGTTLQGVAGASNIRIGSLGTCSTTGANLIILGNTATCTTNTSNSFVAGGAATNTASNQFVAGGPALGYLDVYFGEGVTDTTAAGWTLHGTGGSGADNAGGSLTIAPGQATGTGLSGQVSIQRGAQSTTSSTAQSLFPAYISCPSRNLSTASATVATMATITTTSTTGGSVMAFYTSTACSGSTCDADSGIVNVSWNNNAGTVAAAMTAVVGQSDSDATGTLAATPTATVATNVVSIKLTPTWVTIVPTTVTGYVTFFVNGVNSVVCQ